MPLNYLVYTEMTLTTLVGQQSKPQGILMWNKVTFTTWPQQENQNTKGAIRHLQKETEGSGSQPCHLQNAQGLSFVLLEHPDVNKKAFNEFNLG
jgi:hypothetical protein